jgi:Glyoxalase superfamily protein
MAPILDVADGRATSEWYAQLGFEVESEHVFGPDWPLYVRLRRGPAQLRLSEHRLDGGPVTHVYLYVEDVDGIIPAGGGRRGLPVGDARGKADRPRRERGTSWIPAPGSGTGIPGLTDSKIAVSFACHLCPRAAGSASGG